MNPDGLQQFMEQYPEVVLALIQMLMQMDKEQLTQLVNTLQQMVQSKQGGQEGQAQPSPEEAEMSGANQNLYG